MWYWRYVNNLYGNHFFRMGVVVGLLLLSCLGCTSSCQGEHQQEMSDEEYAAEKEKLFEQASSDARDTVYEFIEQVQNRQPQQEYFSIKMEFTDGLASESLWLAEVTYDGHYFYGVVASEPTVVKNVKYADEAKVLPQDILDWVYVDNKKMKGGYTIKAYQNLSKKSKRQEYDQSLPFAVE